MKRHDMFIDESEIGSEIINGIKFHYRFEKGLISKSLRDFLLFL